MHEAPSEALRLPCDSHPPEPRVEVGCWTYALPCPALSLPSVLYPIAAGMSGLHGCPAWSGGSSHMRRTPPFPLLPHCNVTPFPFRIHSHFPLTSAPLLAHACLFWLTPSVLLYWLSVKALITDESSALIASCKRLDGACCMLHAACAGVHAIAVVWDLVAFHRSTSSTCQVNPGWHGV